MTDALLHDRLENAKKPISIKKNVQYVVFSVGRCVIPWEILGKSVKHIFSCREMYCV